MSDEAVLDGRRHPADELRGRRAQRARRAGRRRRDRRRRPDRPAAIIGARLYSPSHIVAIDLADSRLDAAKQFGADVVVNPTREDAVAIVRELTDGLGADVAIEAVGTPEAFELTVRARPARRAHREHRRARQAGDAAPRGAVDQGRHDHDRARSTRTRRRRSCGCSPGHQLDATAFVTHHFTLDQFIEAYDVFARAGETGALKVVLTRA